MLIEVVLRAAHILKSQPGYTMPLARLHAQLVKELGPHAGSYGQIYQQLHRRADSFLILDSPKKLAGTDSWPGAVREAYESALDHAGLGCCVRVTLTEAPPDRQATDILAALNLTMAELVMAQGQEPTVRDFVERAAEQLAEVSNVMLAAAATQPTIPARDPPTAG
jgi:hypothetical protein